MPKPPRTAIDHLDLAALCTEPRQQLALVDAALRLGLIRPADLAGFSQGSRARREWLVRMADGRAESLSETYARVEMVEAGLGVVPQAQVPGVGRVDFIVEDAVTVEIDSEAFHSGEKARARDGSRDRAATTQGYLPMRFSFHDAVERPDQIVADVVGTLTRWERLTPTVRTNLNTAARVSGWRELL
ncbi:DUF559 domain-containing protein [uncultured Demequina sp.]|uniref:DUF559 domain-containing protein n=1 Tax=uncultured Demequina sp. TaxID=693499 RepID=UPI0025F7C190|nr:DUF559 domain-containing protein [uncultured Demequina sp.]